MKKIMVIGPSITNTEHGGVVTYNKILLSIIKTNFTVKYMPLDSKMRLSKLVTSFVKIFFLILFRKVDMIFLNYTISDSTFVKYKHIVNISNQMGIPIIGQIHGGDILKINKIEQTKKLFKKFTKILILSKKQINSILECDLTLKSKLVQNNNFIDPEEYIQPKNAGKSEINLLFLSRIEEAKGIYDLIKAIQILKEKAKVKFKVRICGSGSEVDNVISMLNDYKLNDCVEFMGFVNGDSKNNILYESDIFILPSSHEGMPYALIEAMYCQNGVIITRVGAIPEMLKEQQNCLYTDGRAMDIVNKIEQLIENSELLCNMKQRNKLLVERLYSKRKFQNEVLKLIKNTIEN